MNQIEEREVGWPVAGDGFLCMSSKSLIGALMKILASNRNRSGKGNQNRGKQSFPFLTMFSDLPVTIQSLVMAKGLETMEMEVRTPFPWL